MKRRDFLKVVSMAALAPLVPLWMPKGRPKSNGAVPVGYLLLGNAESQVPEGWLLCNGQQVSREDYPELYAVIGTAYGDVDFARRTFALPDLQGRVEIPYEDDRGHQYIATTAWIKT